MTFVLCPVRSNAAARWRVLTKPVIPTATIADGGLLRCTVCGLWQGVREMPQGKIKKLVSDKGFGFIQGDRGDLFFHLSALQESPFESLQVGQDVHYEEESGPKGPRATAVTIID